MTRHARNSEVDEKSSGSKLDQEILSDEESDGEEEASQRLPVPAAAQIQGSMGQPSGLNSLYKEYKERL